MAMRSASFPSQLICAGISAMLIFQTIENIGMCTGLMPVIGLNNGMVPIIAFNYGAQNKERIMKTIRLSVISAVCIMLAGFAVFQIAPGILMSLFKAKGEMLDIGIQALKVISYCFIFAGYSIVIASNMKIFIFSFNLTNQHS